ncbi:hypothetical protein GCM10008983_11510 [Lentibacillus halophilus]|uniref:DNA-directed RNA polymerase subunit beta n=1 Tax=Lentibacillus halophilus TaxID=295065 RepID=A0ABN0Z7G4_9BACI
MPIDQKDQTEQNDRMTRDEQVAVQDQTQQQTTGETATDDAGTVAQQQSVHDQEEMTGVQTDDSAPDETESEPNRRQRRTGVETDDVTRKEHKKKRKQEKRRHQKPHRRMFPIWLRMIVVLALSVVALAVGLMVGYGVVGDGNPIDALQWKTWQHMIDIVTKPR